MANECIINWGKEDLEHKRNYFNALRELMAEVELLRIPAITEILNKYNVHNVNMPGNDIEHRLNIDFPKEA